VTFFEISPNFYRQILSSRSLSVLQNATVPITAHPVQVTLLPYELEGTALKCGGNLALSNLKFSSSPVRQVLIECSRLQYFISYLRRLGYSKATAVGEYQNDAETGL
jgi:hypothetical protein